MNFSTCIIPSINSSTSYHFFVSCAAHGNEVVRFLRKWSLVIGLYSCLQFGKLSCTISTSSLFSELSACNLLTVLVCSVLVLIFIHCDKPTLLCFITAHLTTLARPVNYFDVFTSSLMVLLGQLVFEYHIAPSHLEPVAQKLNLNLVYNIVCNCCPKIPSLLPNIALNFGNGCGKNWGKIVLNNSRVSMCK